MRPNPVHHDHSSDGGICGHLPAEVSSFSKAPPGVEAIRTAPSDRVEIIFCETRLWRPWQERAPLDTPSFRQFNEVWF